MKRLKRIYFILITTVTGLGVYAQERPQFVTLEIFGNGDYISANYDSRFTKQNSGLGFRVGVGSNAEDFRHPTLSIPIGINYLLGKNKNFAEFGIVAVSEKIFQNIYGQKFSFRTRGNLGYRYVSKKGIMFNVLWTPQLTVNNSFERSNKEITKLLWFGFGVGIKL